jgi:hypothetical protein
MTSMARAVEAAVVVVGTSWARRSDLGCNSTRGRGAIARQRARRLARRICSRLADSQRTLRFRPRLQPVPPRMLLPLPETNNQKRQNQNQKIVY